jgi:EpsD family peptidyl-prolyl cis-trans isomerase
MRQKFSISPRLVLTLLALSVALVACGGDKSKTATQAAARVNDGEITVHQINQVLEQQRGLQADQAEAAGRQALERLIDQELALQKAKDLKLDREPRVVAAIEAAKREIIARAYADKVGDSVGRPSPSEVQAYFNDNPGLFSNRRVYTLLEMNVPLPADRIAAVQARVLASRDTAELSELLKAQGYTLDASQARQVAAETLPLPLVGQLNPIAEGHSLAIAAPEGLKVIHVRAARPAPVTLEQARGAIEQFLLNDRRRNTIEADIKTLRSAAKIEYLGKFAEPAATAAAPVSAQASAPAAPAPGTNAAGADSAPASGVAGSNPSNPDSNAATPGTAPEAAASGLSAETLKKGLGLK